MPVLLLTTMLTLVGPTWGYVVLVYDTQSYYHFIFCCSLADFVMPGVLLHRVHYPRCWSQCNVNLTEVYT